LEFSEQKAGSEIRAKASIVKQKTAPIGEKKRHREVVKKVMRAGDTRG
jgi:hypothetical protein